MHRRAQTLQTAGQTGQTIHSGAGCPCHGSMHAPQPEPVLNVRRRECRDHDTRPVNVTEVANDQQGLATSSRPVTLARLLFALEFCTHCVLCSLVGLHLVLLRFRALRAGGTAARWAVVRVHAARPRACAAERQTSSSSSSSSLPFFFLFTTFFCDLFEPSPLPLTGCAARRARGA